MADRKGRGDPLVWVLLADRAGGNGQLLSLAEALGWPYERKSMAYGWRNRVPNLFLGASLAGVRQEASSPLQPPWPDLVIGASRRSVPVARWIREQSGGRAKLVHLLHTMAPLDLFDLVITTPQYRLPARRNVLQLAAPLNRIAEVRLRAAAAQWEPQLAALRRPRIALLVGGDSATYRFDAATARRLGQLANARAQASGGTLLVSTSPRTPAAAADALVSTISAPSFVYRWRSGDADNPYLAFLALADAFVVTADSASQLVEACLTGKPVELFAWPMRGQLPLRAKEWLWRRSGVAGEAGGSGRGALAGLLGRLVDLGLVKPPRDFEALHRALRARGLIATVAGEAPATARQPLDDMERAVAAIRRLFAPGARAGAP